MFNKIPRDGAYVLDLKGFIEMVYGFKTLSIAEAERGWYGETWKVICEKSCYFIKIVYSKTHMARYIRSFPAIEFMNEHGMDFISKIVKTKDGELFCHFRGGALGVFHFVEGIHTEDYPLEFLFEKLAAIYRLEPEVLSLPTEAFDIRYLEEFYNKLVSLNVSTMQGSAELLSVIEDNKDQIECWAERLKLFSLVCKADLNDFHLTSGDVGGNVIIDSEKFYIIDWDYIMYSPIERDLWFYMHDDRQTQLINKVLYENGIDYKLKTSRLAFYCYSGFFYYLCEYLNCFFECDGVQEALIKEIKNYLDENYWIYGCLKKADVFSEGSREFS